MKSKIWLPAFVEVSHDQFASIESLKKDSVMRGLAIANLLKEAERSELAAEHASQLAKYLRQMAEPEQG